MSVALKQAITKYNVFVFFTKQAKAVDCLNIIVIVKYYCAATEVWLLQNGGLLIKLIVKNCFLKASTRTVTVATYIIIRILSTLRIRNNLMKVHWLTYLNLGFSKIIGS